MEKPKSWAKYLINWKAYFSLCLITAIYYVFKIYNYLHIYQKAILAILFILSLTLSTFLAKITVDKTNKPWQKGALIGFSFLIFIFLPNFVFNVITKDSIDISNSQIVNISSLRVDNTVDWINFFGDYIPFFNSLERNINSNTYFEIFPWLILLYSFSYALLGSI